MTKTELVIIADYSEESLVSLAELCDVCGIRIDSVHDYIEYEIIRPVGNRPEEWVFDLTQMRRMKTALRLQHDLEVNLAGAALVLDLLEELEQLRAHARHCEPRSGEAS
jgi:chaperone modulatory protein CbpM